MPDSIDVTRNDAGLQYEVELNGTPAGLIRYRVDGDVLDMVHTEVDPEFEGGGVGSTLVQRALDDVRERGLYVRPSCPFVAAYIEQHPDYADLVAS
jgi:predicted GNAT family acetyltransferase